MNPQGYETLPGTDEVYRDRSLGLVVFGVIEILIGAFCALLVPLAHALVAFPFVLRSLLPALRSIPPKLREAAAVLGAGPWKVWQTVDLPILGRALVVGAVFAFTISLGEFGATLFVARPQTPTMPLAIYRFLGQPGAANYGQAMAMSSILMLVSATGFMFIEKFRLGHGGEF